MPSKITQFSEFYKKSPKLAGIFNALLSLESNLNSYLGSSVNLITIPLLSDSDATLKNTHSPTYGSPSSISAQICKELTKKLIINKKKLYALILTKKDNKTNQEELQGILFGNKVDIENLRAFLTHAPSVIKLKTEIEVETIELNLIENSITTQILKQTSNGYC